MGVGEDFSIFKQNYIIPMPKILSISKRYKNITKRLNADFWGINSERKNSYYVGSYGRDTAALGISDLDIGFLLPKQLYLKYDFHIYNGQSKLLQAVRTSIQKTYATSTVSGDGQVVVIKFFDGITFEVLPAFEQIDGSWKHPDANRGGRWSKTNPKAEIRAISQENIASNGNLKCLARMMRCWKHKHNVPLSGWLIDTLAFRFIRQWAYKHCSFFYHDWMARDFFLFMASQNINQTYWKAPGSNMLVPSMGNFQLYAAHAYQSATMAIEQELAGHEWSSRQTWRSIFGTSFPN
jgi:hypothetical protein